MKKILITGVNSYIGNSFEEWIKKYNNQYQINTIDMRGNEWRSSSFEGYDAILHVAAIVHKKEKKSMEHLYTKVNKDLPIEVAKKAKSEGVKQFVFMSSMSVYGIDEGIISEDTIPNPKSKYGKSKLQAEKELMLLNDKKFNISIIRPPMVYGENCVGNYSRLSKLAKRIFVFPEIKNQRSMIYIYNLCEFIRIIIEENVGGIFFPQNEEYVSTSELVRLISNEHNLNIRFVKYVGCFIKLINISIIRKVFGNLTYKKELSKYKNINYNIFTLEKSIKRTEGQKNNE